MSFVNPNIKICQMAPQTQKLQNAITLRGSAQLVAEYINYGVNSILFQRGIYPPETFQPMQKYGLTMLMSTDDRIIDFLNVILKQLDDWITQNLIKKVSMVITNVRSRECLERWDFVIESDIPPVYRDAQCPASTKELKVIQAEIREVLRQISATVSYLPLLDNVCTFDLYVHANPDCTIPILWDETEEAKINNSQTVQLRQFSTGLHRITTVVNYKMT